MQSCDDAMIAVISLDCYRTMGQSSPLWSNTRGQVAVLSVYNKENWSDFAWSGMKPGRSFHSLSLSHGTVTEKPAKMPEVPLI